ncbi:DUF6218 family protein [Saccharopolyspora taberi]|uniref:Uncharacterized protein n=1 Tax=Saccharopolyspora taberi TaxID=60895 RepID=A0ABN3V2G4_9PSEU
MLGHAVFGSGTGNDGRDSIAVWHVSIDCRNVGAWIFACEDALHDSATAARIVAITSGRVVAGWDNEAALSRLEEIHRVAGAAAGTHAITVQELLDEIAGTRAEYQARVREEQERSRTVADLAWAVELPETAGSAGELARAAGLAAPPGSCPAAEDALLTSMLLNWCLQAWQDTTAALGRKYLRETFGEPRELPGKWEDALRAAYAAGRTARMAAVSR